MYIGARGSGGIRVHAEDVDAIVNGLLDNGSGRFTVNGGEGDGRVLVIDEGLQHGQLLREQVSRRRPLEGNGDSQLSRGATRSLLGGSPER